MYNENNLKECQNEIKRLKEERKKDYEKLVTQYKIAEVNLKNNPIPYGGEEKIKSFMEGLLSGMVLLNDNLQSQVCDSEKYNYLAPITPNNCLICGSRYSGGATYKGEPMNEGARVFFKCGSMSFKKIDDGIYQLLVKCTKESEIKYKDEREKKN